MATIKEIAKRAGVSTATVSRVINKTGYVNEKTRVKVENIIKECNYIPFAPAVNLSKRETNTIGIIVPEITNSFFGEIIYGISEILDESDTVCLFFDTNNNRIKEERAILALEQHRVKGLIITPASDSDSDKKLYNALERLNVPTVVVDRDFTTCKWDGVFFENYQSAYCACEALIKAGNKDLGIITGDLNLKIAQERYNGFMQAAKDNGIEVKKQHIYQGDFTVECAYQKTLDMVKSGDMPQAILTCNNLTSMGFLKAISEKHLIIGKDIAVIGIDHIPELDILNFGFSCITRDAVEMGKIAAKTLIERINNPDKQRQITMMGYKLMLKGSENTINQ